MDPIRPISSTSVTITPMTPQDIPHAISCIQNAFVNDPYRNWVFPDGKTYNAKRNVSSLRVRCHWGIRHGMFQVARDSSTGQFLGVAEWLPPRLATPKALAKMSWADWWAVKSSEWELWFAQLATNAWHMGRGGLDVSRYWVWKDVQGKAQEELWTDDSGYYFCNIVTVVPEAQGRGVGRALVEEVTSVADREGRSCYLESSRMVPNVEIYGKMGFELVKKINCTDPKGGEGVELFCMIRKPAAIKN